MPRKALGGSRVEDGKVMKDCSVARPRDSASDQKVNHRATAKPMERTYIKTIVKTVEEK